MPTKLLLADDSVTIHKVFGLTFAAEDVQIETVTDGGQALEKIRTWEPDIVLADVFMPVLNGYQVCAAIKADPELALIPVVLLVGTLEPFDEQEASRVQCDAYLTKPFDTSELIKIVHHLASQHKEARSSVAIKETVTCGNMGACREADSALSGLVTARTRESFLGAARILDLFEVPAVGNTVRQDVPQPKPDSRDALPEDVFTPEANPVSELSDDVIERIVEKVVRRMSDAAVREIAWEVVPAISEAMVRQYLDELRSKKD